MADHGMSLPYFFMLTEGGQYRTTNAETNNGLGVVKVSIGIKNLSASRLWLTFRYVSRETICRESYRYLSLGKLSARIKAKNDMNVSRETFGEQGLPSN